MDDTARAHTTDVAHLRQMAQAIPDETPATRLRVLQARYSSTTDPVVDAVPPDYRRALLDRIAQLLTSQKGITS
jgi:hypothetical protein